MIGTSPHGFKILVVPLIPPSFRQILPMVKRIVLVPFLGLEVRHFLKASKIGTDRSIFGRNSVVSVLLDSGDPLFVSLGQLDSLCASQKDGAGDGGEHGLSHTLFCLIIIKETRTKNPAI